MLQSHQALYAIKNIIKKKKMMLWTSFRNAFCVVPKQYYFDNRIINYCFVDINQRKKYHRRFLTSYIAIGTNFFKSKTKFLECNRIENRITSARYTYNAFQYKCFFGSCLVIHFLPYSSYCYTICDQAVVSKNKKTEVIKINCCTFRRNVLSQLYRSYRHYVVQLRL